MNITVDNNEIFKDLLKFKNLKSLTISGENILFIPKEIGLLRTLVKLEIRAEIIGLPTSISEIKNLEYLSINQEKMPALSADFFDNFKKLKILHLFHGTNFSKSIGKLKELEELLYTGRILNEDLQIIGELKNLVFLDIENERKTFDYEKFTIPANWESLRNLKKLYIGLAGRPIECENFKYLEKLEYVTIFFNNDDFRDKVLLKKSIDFPNSIWKLKNLESLNLLNVNFKNLGRIKDPMHNLKSINILKGNLIEINGTIRNLPQLAQLSINHAGLEKIHPKIGKLKYLEKIDLKNNTLKDVSWIAKMKLAATINLSYNSIDKLPNKMLDLNNLESLNLSFNKIETLPSKFRNLGNLTILSLDHNRINFIPKDINELKKLETLLLNSNLITEMPNLDSLRNLLSISLSKNKFENFPETILNSKKLKFLSISDNFISDIPNDINSLKDLESLNLSNNKIEFVNLNFSSISKLSSLNLSQNKIKSIRNLDFNSLIDLGQNYDNETGQSFNLSNNPIVEFSEDQLEWLKKYKYGLNVNIFYLSN